MDRARLVTDAGSRRLSGLLCWYSDIKRRRFKWSTVRGEGARGCGPPEKGRPAGKRSRSALSGLVVRERFLRSLPLVVHVGTTTARGGGGGLDPTTFSTLKPGADTLPYLLYLLTLLTLLTYLLTYLLTHLLTYSLTHLRTYLLACLLARSLACLLAC